MPEQARYVILRGRAQGSSGRSYERSVIAQLNPGDVPRRARPGVFRSIHRGHAGVHLCYSASLGLLVVSTVAVPDAPILPTSRRTLGESADDHA